jgi:hypothetical protein
VPRAGTIKTKGPCEKCGEPRVAGERFCTKCRKTFVNEMKETYLVRWPKLFYGGAHGTHQTGALVPKGERAPVGYDPELHPLGFALLRTIIQRQHAEYNEVWKGLDAKERQVMRERFIRFTPVAKIGGAIKWRDEKGNPLTADQSRKVIEKICRHFRIAGLPEPDMEQHRKDWVIATECQSLTSLNDKRPPLSMRRGSNRRIVRDSDAR